MTSLVKATVGVVRRVRRASANSTTPESRVVAAVKRWAVLHKGVYLVRVVQGGESGIADIILCIKGRFVAVECKATGEKPRALQMVHGERMQNAGGIFIWGDNATVIPELDKIYSEL